MKRNFRQQRHKARTSAIKTRTEAGEKEGGGGGGGEFDVSHLPCNPKVYYCGWTFITSHYRIPCGFKLSSLRSAASTGNLPPGVFFTVVQNQSLSLYDSEDQRQCFGDIPMDGKTVVEIYPKCDLYIDEVFSRDLPICLRRNQRRLFLYTASNNEKEDWFYCLRKACKYNPRIYSVQEGRVRRQFFAIAAESVSASRQFAWLNSLIARMLYTQIRSHALIATIKAKFVRRLAITPIPFFVGRVELTEVSLGLAPPVITGARHHYTTELGETMCSVDILYDPVPVDAGAHATIHTVIKLESRLTGNWTVPVALLVRVLRVKGRVQLLIRPPPTDRLWFAFVERPEVELSVDTNSAGLNAVKPLIKAAIERAVVDGIADTMLVPNYSDTPIPPAVFGDEELWERPYAHSSKQPGAMTPPRPPRRADPTDCIDPTDSTDPIDCIDPTDSTDAQ